MPSSTKLLVGIDYMFRFNIWKFYIIIHLQQTRTHTMNIDTKGTQYAKKQILENQC